MCNIGWSIYDSKVYYFYLFYTSSWKLKKNFFYLEDEARYKKKPKKLFFIEVSSSPKSKIYYPNVKFNFMQGSSVDGRYRECSSENKVPNFYR